MAESRFDPRSLDAESIVDEARERASLRDFGDESFREPMRRMLEAYEKEADLNENGRMAQRDRTVGLLVNRLRVQNWLERHPEIHDEELRVPAVVCGLPRTGTTMLHRLLASDPDTFAAFWYECRHPAPFEGNDWTLEDARIPAAQEEVRQTLEAVPGLASVHPWDPMAPDEEIMLLENTFMAWMPEAHANVPEFGRWLREQDRRPAYEYLKTLLRFLQWQKRQAGSRASRWVLKAPFHLGVVDVLLEAFPDAKVVQTHRDPVEAIPSIASMVHHLWEMGADAPDPHSAGRQWSRNFAIGLKATLEFRDKGHEDRFVDVWFKDSVRNPLGSVGKVYDFLHRSLTPIAEDKMRKWTEDNAREKRPPHEYTLDKFGLTEEGIARDFSEYRERYILP